MFGCLLYTGPYSEQITMSHRIWQAQWASKQFGQVFWRMMLRSMEGRDFPTSTNGSLDHRDVEDQKSYLIPKRQKEQKRQTLFLKEKEIPKNSFLFCFVFCLNIKDSGFFKLWMWLVVWEVGGNETKDLQGRSCRKTSSLMERVKDNRQITWAE